MRILIFAYLQAISASVSSPLPPPLAGTSLKDSIHALQNIAKFYNARDEKDTDPGYVIQSYNNFLGYPNRSLESGDAWYLTLYHFLCGSSGENPGFTRGKVCHPIGTDVENVTQSLSKIIRGAIGVPDYAHKHLLVYGSREEKFAGFDNEIQDFDPNTSILGQPKNLFVQFWNSMIVENAPTRAPESQELMYLLRMANRALPTMGKLANVKEGQNLKDSDKNQFHPPRSP
jgi:hypothetical protein